jgi:hypothetical protein
MSKLLSFAALLLTVTATTAVSAAEKITLIHSVPQLTSLFAFGSSKCQRCRRVEPSNRT